jgi:hypothetical protein
MLPMSGGSKNGAIRALGTRQAFIGIIGHGDNSRSPPWSTQTVHSTSYSLLLLRHVTLLVYQDLCRVQPRLVTDTDQASLPRPVAM